MSELAAPPAVSSTLSRQAMAYVLAGGRGSRLLEMTDVRAKPAVYFGGKFRIIDFALSNALNSGIRRIAVATQYRAHSLIRHMQRGWNFFRQGGLGFGFKWNMGWMNDTLEYVSKDPVYRRHHHRQLTFGLIYAFSENFVLPLSHDEVVHGKGSILGRMPGDDWRQFANARAYYGFMWGYPGKKLMFMGQEFGQRAEWNFNEGLDWDLLEHARHQGLQRVVGDLNRLYRETPALHARDCEADGFRWIVVDDDAQSVAAWLRFGAPGDPPVAVVCNFTPEPRRPYRIGLPHAGRWREVFNSDAEVYGGSGLGNLGGTTAHETPSHGFPASAEIVLPPLAAVYFRFEPDAASA